MAEFPSLPSWHPMGAAVLNGMAPNTPIWSAYIQAGQTGASATWPAANRAIYLPITVEEPCTVYDFGCFNGTVVSGNINMGITDRYGNVLTSTGSTAQSGTSAPQKVAAADVALVPGDYYLAMNCDNTTATVWRVPVTNVTMAASMIHSQDIGAIAFPNPVTLTAGNPSSAYIPLFWAITDPSIW